MAQFKHFQFTKFDDAFFQYKPWAPYLSFAKLHVVDIPCPYHMYAFTLARIRVRLLRFFLLWTWAQITTRGRIIDYQYRLL